MSMHLVAIDDEQAALDIIQTFSEKTPAIKEAKIFLDAFEGFHFLKEQPDKVDALIIDMDMPDLHGEEFLKEFNDKIPIIISSGFTDYAIKGFDYNVVDFLAKPFTYSRFLKAIEKIQTAPNDSAKNTTEETHIFLKQDGEIYKTEIEDIQYVEAYGNYVKVITPNKTYVVTGTMKKFLAQLPTSKFVRIHKSHIINILHIHKVMGNQVMIHDKTLLIGASYRQDFFAHLKKYSFGTF